MPQKEGRIKNAEGRGSSIVLDVKGKGTLIIQRSAPIEIERALDEAKPPWWRLSGTNNITIVFKNTTPNSYQTS